MRCYEDLGMQVQIQPWMNLQPLLLFSAYALGDAAMPEVAEGNGCNFLSKGHWFQQNGPTEFKRALPYCTQWPVTQEIEE